MLEDEQDKMEAKKTNQPENQTPFAKGKMKPPPPIVITTPVSEYKALNNKIMGIVGNDKYTMSY